jgi:hypothetical protein
LKAANVLGVFEPSSFGYIGMTTNYEMIFYGAKYEPKQSNSMGEINFDR